MADIVSTLSVTNAQHRVEALRELIGCLNNNQASDAEVAEYEYDDDKRILYRRADDEHPRRIVLPAELRPMVMRMYHDDATAGHRDRDTTYRRVSVCFYRIRLAT